MSQATYWIGVDLGGTKILAGLFDANLKLLNKFKLSTDFEDGGKVVFSRVVQAVDQVIADGKIQPSQIGGLCIAVPGQVIPKTTVVRYAPNLQWRDFDLAPLFPSHWKWPVLIDNDVNMGTYGEWALGAAVGSRHVFGVFAGTGVGGGLILNNELFHGFNGHAGEIGHTIIGWKRGTTLENIAGRRNLMNRAKELIADAPKSVRKIWKNIDPTTFKSSTIAQYVEQQDPIMLQVMDEAARAIGAGVGTVVNLLSPEVVVIGGGVTKALGASFPDRIWEFASRYALPRAIENVRCVMSALGDDAGITGAAAYIQRNTK